MHELCLEPASHSGDAKRIPRELGRRRFVKSVTLAAPARQVQKWSAFHHLCLARAKFGLSDRTLAVLEALLTFHPDSALKIAADDLVVFPSNRQLSIRARGMAASTLRRHLAVLVDRGLLLRRDSSNGKRYARRNTRGDIEEAFGFDLGLFVARVEEFESAAADVERLHRRIAGLKAKVTIMRRDIAQMIAAGAETNPSFDWATLHRRLIAIIPAPRRVSEPEALERAQVELTQLESECLAHLEDALTKDEFPPLHDANESRFSEGVSPSDLEAGACLECENPSERVPATIATPEPRDHPAEPASNMEGGHAAVEAVASEPQKPGISRVPLALVVAACPDISHYARGGFRTFRDLCAAADLVRTLLGVTPDGWGEACRVLGREGAAIVIAAILQRGDAIKNPGGYLRTLTRRAATGRFSVWPMLMALESARRKAAAAENPHDCSTGGSRPVALRCS